MPSQQIDQSGKFTPRLFYGYIVLAASFLIMVAILGLHVSFGVLFKPILAEFGWTRGIIAGAFSLSNIVHGLLSIVMGWLNDRFGPRAVMTLCGILSGLGYLLMSQINDVWHLYLVYGFLVGAGSAVFVPLLSTVARWYVRRRSMMTGIVVAGAGVGILIMPLIINRLILAYDWRASCTVLGIGVLVIGVLAAQLLKRDPNQVGQVAYGEDKSAEMELKSGTRALSLREAVSTRQFWIFFAMLGCSGFCAFAIQVHMVVYAIDQGISATSAASILAILGGANIVGQVALGSTGDRIGNRRSFLMGFVVMSVALLWLLLARELWGLYLFAIVFGLGFGNNTTQESPLIARLFGLASHGLIFGILAFGFTIGGAIGPLLAGHIFDITGDYKLAFLITTAIGFVGIILICVLKPIKHESLSEKLSN